LHMKHSNNNFANASLDFVHNICKELAIPLEVVDISKVKQQRNKSLEALWSAERAKAYSTAAAPVLVAHTLEDAAEWWMMRAIRGKQPTLIAPKSGNVFRPFLMWRKEDMKDFLTNRKRAWLEDPTNLDGKSNMRSVIRARIMPTIDEIGDLKPVLSSMYAKMEKNE